jgi:hypothetical protein
MGPFKFQMPERRQEIALLGAFVFVGLVIAHDWVLRPHVTALHASQQYKQAAGMYKEKGARVNSELRAKRGWLAKQIERRALVSDMVFSPAKAEEFQSDFEAFCVETGCTIGSVAYVGEQQQGVSAIVARTTSLTVYGGYNGIIQLIQKLKSRSQNVSIDSLRMATIPTNPRNVACCIVITIYVNLDLESEGNEEAQMP